MWQLQPGVLTRPPIDALAGPPPLGIAGTPVTSATVGVPYAGFTVTASLGTAPYSYSVASGSLPPGITLNSSSGAVSGTPSTAGSYAGIVIRVTDAVSATADLAPFTIVVAVSTAIAVLDGVFVSPRGSATLVGTEIIDSGPVTVF